MVNLDRNSRASLGEKLVDAANPPVGRSPARKATRLRIRTPANRFGDSDELLAPDGWTYEWKVKTVHGQPAHEQIINWKQNGWTEVPAGRHPSFSGEPMDSTAAIERGGQVLCERPEELTNESKKMEKAMADDQVNSQLERLQLKARAEGTSKVTKLKRTVEAIPDEDPS